MNKMHVAATGRAEPDVDVAKEEGPFSRWASAYVGQLESVEGGHARGWAWLPRRPGYSPLVHAIDRARVVSSAVVTAPTDPAKLLDATAYRFDLDLSSVPADRRAHLVFVVGETDQELLAEPPLAAAAREKLALNTITVEDLIAIRPESPWVRGATYHDVLEAGLSAEEIIDMVYRDYLGRPADEAGRDFYLAELRDGRTNYDELRRSLARSHEYWNRVRGRTIPLGLVPGSYFSDILLYAPKLPLPGETPDHLPLKVSAKTFEALWGDEFLRGAYSAICRALLADEIYAPLAAMLDAGAYSKLDIANEMLKLANAFSPAVELVDEERLASWPARRHHEAPLSMLVDDTFGREYVANAYRVICGAKISASARDEIVAEMLDGRLGPGDVLRQFLTEARNERAIPAVMALDRPEAESLIDEAGRKSVEIVLDKRAVGYGWHKNEQAGAIHYRWMSESAGLIAPPLDSQGGDVVLTVEGYAFVDESVAEGLICAVNGVVMKGRVKVEKTGQWSFASDPTPRARLVGRYPYVVSFRAPGAKDFQNPKDPRFLTVAIAGVRLGEAKPAAGAATRRVDEGYDRAAPLTADKAERGDSWTLDPQLSSLNKPPPGEKPGRSPLKVLAKSFEAAWGEEFLRTAYQTICRAPLADNARASLLAMLDAETYSKLDVAEEIVALANADFSTVELVDGERLAPWPARRHHEVPLSALVDDGFGPQFIEKAYAAICGVAMPAAARGKIAAEMAGGRLSPGEILRRFVAQAQSERGIPAVIGFDRPEAESLFDEAGTAAVDIVLDKGAVGYGWHKQEQAGELHFRWMSEAAGLIAPQLDSEGGDIVLTVEGFAAVNATVAEGLVCSVNGVTLEGRVELESNGRWSFVSEPTPRSLLAGRYPYIVSFRAPGAEAYQNPKDPRYLTVAISRVRLSEPWADVQAALNLVAQSDEDAAPAEDLAEAGKEDRAREPLPSAPKLPLSEEAPVRAPLKVSATMFEPLWGEEFVRGAYQAICRAPLAEDLRAFLLAMLDLETHSKLDVTREMLALANAVSLVVELVDEERLAQWPARRYHEVPLSALVDDGFGPQFVESAYAAICGAAIPPSERDNIARDMLDGRLRPGGVLRRFLAEARSERQVPAVISLDRPEAESLIDEAGRKAIDIVLDKDAVGYGWHKEEEAGEIHFRWMTDAAGLIAPPLDREGGDVVLTVEGYASVNASVVEGFACSINGVPMEGRAKQENSGRWSFVSDPVARSRLAGRYPYIVNFRAPGAGAFQNPKDPRYLTVAVAAIRLAEPAHLKEAGAIAPLGGDPRGALAADAAAAAAKLGV